MNATTAMEYVTLTLSIVALVVTVLGFFASLKFYRDGAEMQGNARDALSRIDEKTIWIQAQVGGVFEKTLDAALQRAARVEREFDAVDEELADTVDRIVESAASRIGMAAEHHKADLRAVVYDELKEVRDLIDKTRGDAGFAKLVHPEFQPRVSLLEYRKVRGSLERAGFPLSLDELRERTRIGRSRLEEILPQLEALNAVVAVGSEGKEEGQRTFGIPNTR